MGKLRKLIEEIGLFEDIVKGENVNNKKSNVLYSQVTLILGKQVK